MGYDSSLKSMEEAGRSFLVFSQVLSLVQQDKVSFLHLRPAGSDKIGVDVHAH